jgi:hypothetical protein
MGWAHARVVAAWGGERGQGTVEYVALILLVAGIFAAVVATGGKDAGGKIAGKISREIQNQINSVGAKK